MILAAIGATLALLGPSAASGGADADAHVVPAAPAADGPRIELERLTVEGELTDADRELLTQRLRTAFADAGAQVVTSGGDFIVRPSLRVLDRDYRSDVEVVDAETQKVVATSSERCDLCGLGDAGDTIARQAGSLSLKLAKLVSAVATLRVSGDPEGAAVFLDGAAAGVTPLELQLAPGRHTVELRADGYVTKQREIDSVGGVRDRWSFALTPTTPAQVDAPGPPVARDRLLPAGIGMLAGGAALTAVGVSFVILEERPYAPGCTRDAMDRCPRRWRSLEFGAAMVAVGGAALVGGAVLAAIGGKRRRRQQARGLRMQGMGVAGRF